MTDKIAVIERQKDKRGEGFDHSEWKNRGEHETGQFNCLSVFFTQMSIVYLEKLKN
jgi:hypothetical protein